MTIERQINAGEIINQEAPETIILTKRCAPGVLWAYAHYVSGDTIVKLHKAGYYASVTRNLDDEIGERIPQSKIWVRKPIEICIHDMQE